MASLKDVLQTADWKSEKHVPVIEAADAVKSRQPVKITVSVGKEIAHPNTTEHHISWVEVYFQPQGEKFPYLVSRVDLAAHGASAQGPNTSTVYTQSEASCVLVTEKSGTILVLSFCNVHGLWESSKELTVE